VGADGGDNVPNFVAAVRRLGPTPHVALKAPVQRDRWPRDAHRRLCVSRRKRKLVEQVFG
jgi:hypothetical protein